MVISILGITFGFFIGCSTISSLKNKDSQSQSEDSLSISELKERLGQIDEQIDRNPENAEAFFQKGNVLSQLAQKQNPPQDRTDYYQQMRSALVQATSLYQTDNELQAAGKVDELLQVSWSYEHNQGVEILQSDSTLESSDLDAATAHFNNAIVIIPDSAISYKMKARALYQNHQMDEAIQTLYAAQNRINPLPSGVLEQLAYLYLESDQVSKAVELYEQAESFSDDNLNLLHGLANAYIISNEHQKAVDLLDQLVQNEPENIIYLDSYGAELYQLGIQKFDSLNTMEADDSVAVNKIKTEADTLIYKAEDQFKKSLSLNPEQTEIKHQLASLYQNYAFHLKRVAPLFSDSIQSDIETEIKNNLSTSISLFEELVEQQPDHPEYWKTLYQAYSYLGMQEKASQAKAKANL